MIVAEYPQLTDGYACRLEDVDPSNAPAANAALRCLAFAAAIGKPGAAETFRAAIEGRAGFSKVSGVATIVALPALCHE